MAEKEETLSSVSNVDLKPICKYGARCYRKNTDHIENYRHLRNTDEEKSPAPRAKRQKKEEDSAASKPRHKISDYFVQDSPRGVIFESPRDKQKAVPNQHRNTPTKDDHLTTIKSPERVDSVKQNNVTNTHTSPTKKPSNNEDRLGRTEHCISPSLSDEDTTSESVTKCGDEPEEDNKSAGHQVAECIDDLADLPRLDSPIDPRDNIKQKYEMEMPEDFYQFWDFCKRLHPDKPTEALKPLLGYTLVGPYDILNGSHKRSRKTRPNYMLHCRYYYDPPEFMTVIKGDDSDQFHIGYYRDDPNELPSYVASNSAAIGCAITPKGDNLFTALKYFVNEKLKDDDLSTKTREDLIDLQTEAVTMATELGHSLEMKTAAMKKRDKRVVCKTMNGVGIVVPVDSNDVGYRPVPETLPDLKRMFKRIVDSKTPEDHDKNFEPLQEIITYIQFANDECDYGEGLELGLQLFCWGHETFHGVMSHLLPTAYQLLNRQLFAHILQDHLTHRTCKCSLNQLA